MTKLDIEEKTLKQNSLLIPIAVSLGTLLAIIAYNYLPPNTALISIFAGTIIVALITYAVITKKKEH